MTARRRPIPAGTTPAGSRVDYDAGAPPERPLVEIVPVPTTPERRARAQEQLQAWIRRVLEEGGR